MKKYIPCKHYSKLYINYVYVLNRQASKHMRQKLMELKGEIDKPTSSFGDFTVSLSVIDRKGRLIISKNI